MMKSTVKSGLRALAVLMAVLAVPAAQAAREMVEPPPIHVPTELGEAGASKAIRSALFNRGWTIVQEQPGDIQARLAKGNSWSATIDIPYTAEEIQLKYLDSANLDYSKDEDGTRHIHGNFNRWMNFLVQDINKSFIDQGK